MSLKFKPELRVFIFSEQIDLRAGFDRLSNLVREKMQAKLVDGDLFVFFGRSRRLQKKFYGFGRESLNGNRRIGHSDQQLKLHGERPHDENTATLPGGEKVLIHRRCRW